MGKRIVPPVRRGRANSRVQRFPDARHPVPAANVCMVCDWQGLGAECRVEVEVESEGCWRRGVRSGGAVEMGGVRAAVSLCWQAGTSSVAASRALP